MNYSIDTDKRKVAASDIAFFWGGASLENLFYIWLNFSLRLARAHFGELVDEKKIICVAGPIAAGKNYVCSLLEGRGFLCVDADILIHQIIQEKAQEILAAFEAEASAAGIELRGTEKGIDRRALGRLLFGRPELLEKQEKILYPEFERRVIEFIEGQKSAAAANDSEKEIRGIVINAALIYKTPAILARCQKIIYVDAPIFLRAARIRRRDGLPFLQIFRRISSQKNLLKNCRNAAEAAGIEFVRVVNVGKRAARNVLRSL